MLRRWPTDAAVLVVPCPALHEELRLATAAGSATAACSRGPFVDLTGGVLVPPLPIPLYRDPVGLVVWPQHTLPPRSRNDRSNSAG